MVSSINPTERLRVIETGGLTLTEFSQPPSLKVPAHFHESATIFFVIKGFAADEIAGRILQCEPSSLLIRPAGEKHTHHYGREGIHGLVLEVGAERNAQVKSLSPVLDRVGYFKDSVVSGLGMRLHMESRVFDSASELAIEGLLLEMLAYTSRKASRGELGHSKPSWLHRATDFIHESYCQPLRVSEIASIVGVHPAHLAEVFRKHYGCSVGQYVRRLRLDYAAREVILSDKSLAEISATAGFYDQSHFTRLFKRQIGRSPSSIRALINTPKTHTKSLHLSKPN